MNKQTMAEKFEDPTIGVVLLQNCQHCLVHSEGIGRVAFKNRAFLCFTQSYTVQTNCYQIIRATRMKGEWVLTCIYPEDTLVTYYSLG